MPELHQMSDATCQALLRSQVVGRIAVSTPDGPHIVPVNYSVIDDAVVVRTAPYTVLGTHGRDAVLAFEIDQFDHPRHRGWSVVARGRATAVTDPDQLERMRSEWPPRPWADGQRALFLRLEWSELTGRQLGAGWDPLADLPVRRVV